MEAELILNNDRRIWHETHDDDGFNVYLDAYFLPLDRFGVILIWYTQYIEPIPPGAHLAEECKNRLHLITVKSRDYRDTISRAQELWAENSESYISQAAQDIFDRKKK